MQRVVTLGRGDDAVRREKALVREHMIRQREHLSTGEVQDKSKAILNRLRKDPLFERAGCIHCYVSFRNEVDTHRLIEDALHGGIQVVVPISNRKHKELFHYRIEGLDELEVGAFGILEPKPAFRRSVRLSDVDLVVVPGVAFDPCGHRVGRGGGFYDRFLMSVTCPTVALAYDFQVIPRVPSEPHDRQVDRIITEERTYGSRGCEGSGKRY